MKAKGKITHWNHEKGYGFITPSAGAKQVFVHISAFRNRDLAPRVGQMCRFTLSADSQGRPRAEQVSRDGEPAPKTLKRRRPAGKSVRPVVLLLVVVLVAVFGYSRFQKSQPVFFLPEKAAAPPAQVFQCDGRTYCSQMTSCAEARFFIQNCPYTKMDGDGDGVPCERQWCN